jgi:hypothetical protein
MMGKSGVVQYALLDGIVAYLCTETDLGTGGGHFESIDCPLKIEAALMQLNFLNLTLSCTYVFYVFTTFTTFTTVATACSRLLELLVPVRCNRSVVLVLYS